MKKSIVICIATASLMLLTACGGPKSAAKDFAERMISGKTEEARQYCTESARNILSMMGNPFHPGDKFIVTRVDQDGDRAKVYFKTGPNSREQSVDLVKIDGKWLVDIRK